MLARVEPHLRCPVAHLEAVDTAPVQRQAEHAVRHALACGAFGDEILVLLHRIRREIGKPDQLAGWLVADGQRAAVLVLVIARGGPAPIKPILRYAGMIVRPPRRIG